MGWGVFLSLISCFIFLGSAAFKTIKAQDIDTTSSWNGTTDFSLFGVQFSNTIKTVGQYFTAPEGVIGINSWDFYLKPRSSSNDNLNYKAYLFQFDNSNANVVGQEIWSSSQETHVRSSDNFEQINTLVSGDVSITPGKDYVIFFSVYGLDNDDTNGWRFGTPQEDVLSSSRFVFLRSSDPTSSSSTWSGFTFRGSTEYDLAFKIDFIEGSTTLNTEWVQPYAAMQSVGLGSIKNNRDLVLAKAGECNNSGWVIENTDYCIYTNVSNTIASVNGNSSYGSYDYANFNTSINVEKTINDKWKAGIAYGVGSSNLDNYNFSSTTASLSSTNTHYSIYGVKKVSDKFTLKGMIGGSDFDYKGNRNYSTTSGTSTYDTDGYTAEINGIWDIKKTIKNMKTPIRLKPSIGVAYAAHTQDGFSESGSGDLITLEANQAESLLFKTGISLDKQIPMEGGKWLLFPSIALNYEMDTYADKNNRALKGGVTGSSDATTLVSAKTFGQHNGSVKVGADFVLTKDFMFNLNAEYGLAEGGDEQSYGGGFRWQF